MTRVRRLKTLVPAANVVAASNDADAMVGAKQAVVLARKAEAEKITGLFTADLLQIDRAGLSGETGTQEPIIALAALSQATSHIGLVATVSTSFTIRSTSPGRSAPSITPAAAAPAGTP